MNGHTRFYELVLTDKERVSFLTNLWPTLTRRRSPRPGVPGRGRARLNRPAVRSEHTGVAPVTKSVTKRHAISAPHQQIRTLRWVSKALQRKHFTDAHHLGSRGTFRIPATPTRRIGLSSGSRARFGDGSARGPTSVQHGRWSTSQVVFAVRQLAEPRSSPPRARLESAPAC